MKLFGNMQRTQQWFQDTCNIGALMDHESIGYAQAVSFISAYITLFDLHKLVPPQFKRDDYEQFFVQYAPYNNKIIGETTDALAHSPSVVTLPLCVYVARRNIDANVEDVRSFFSMVAALQILIQRKISNRPGDLEEVAAHQLIDSVLHTFESKEWFKFFMVVFKGWQITRGFLISFVMNQSMNFKLGKERSNQDLHAHQRRRDLKAVNKEAKVEFLQFRKLEDAPLPAAQKPENPSLKYEGLQFSNSPAHSVEFLKYEDEEEEKKE